MVSWTARALNTREIGEGPVVIVLDNGLGTAGGQWARHLLRLAAHFRIITYDLACTEAADPEYFDMRRHFEIDGHVADLLDILDEYRLRGCSFVGHGVSGMIGLLAAAERPETIRKAILVGTSPCYLNRPDYHGGLNGRMVDEVFSALAQDYRSWMHGYAATGFHGGADSPVAFDFAGRFLSMRPDCALATAKMILLGDYRDRLDAVTVPAAILHPRNDPAVPIEAARYLQAHLRDSVLEVLDTEDASSPMGMLDLLEDAMARHLGLPLTLPAFGEIGEQAATRH